MRKKDIRIPTYSLGEELVNAISHGVGAGLAIAGLVMMMIKANTTMEYITCSIFGTTMIVLYTMSCIYHALSPNLKGKKILRVLDHCNVYMLVFGTYIPIALLGVEGTLGWILFAFVAIITTLGITFTAIDIDRFQLFSVICHLLNGWSVVIGVGSLLSNIGKIGVLFLVLGGIMYSLGAILYGIGAKKKYMHCVFHFFCLAGSIFHFLCIYLYIL